MKIVASLYPAESLQKQVRAEFPDLSFSFYKGMKELGDEIETAEILMTYGEDLSDAIIEKAKALKWIMVMAAGVEKLPHEAIAKRNILVTNVRGVHKIPMGEFAIGYMLQYAKQSALFQTQQQEKIWNRNVTLRELYDHTLLVVGAGAIGSQIGKYAKVFGMKTIGINRSGNRVEEFDEVYPMEQLNEILPAADYIVSILPSTELTTGVFAKPQFSLMKNEAVFINMGRGSAVNEEDLIEALNNGELAHAFLDVFAQEPLPEDHPFWSSDKVTITPHLTGISRNYLKRGLEIFRRNLHMYLKGENKFENIIDVHRGY
ncbi:D-2-hydroxyacid dehydrogenase [Caldibacillus lycopersici]|uniref:D-2-hydroxyacid dehydrogenase n=1 Tax=Perspicuibacillus lycopersici TaxID=1325689 RepID=A0AAE3LTX2_9BACI|nr:D-2-hydroxyacid dehydrogenase [Perspicuibacillus lycopersici]MCU9614653.1 D-2-hydroxyacid dehydrogenase [Perspicuibacillus lycopersici]